MPMRRVTLRQLRTFTTALRAGSFAGAAEVLHITPPAVTVQMRDLETIAGMPIIERSSSGLKSTDAGREIANAALRIEAALAECADALAALPETYRVVLRMRDLEELNAGEVARRLGLTTGAVKTRHFRGRKKMAEFLRRFTSERPACS